MQYSKTMVNHDLVTASFFSEETCDDDHNQLKALDLCLSALASYPYPFLPIPENETTTTSSIGNGGGGGATFLMQLLEEPRDSKRLKRTMSLGESLGSSDTDGCNYYGSISTSFSSSSSSVESCSLGRRNSVTSLPRLHFRDHIWTYNQRYLAAEAIEQACEAEKGGVRYSDQEQLGNKDGMRLVQLLIACAEAVACRDKTHASTLLSELRANALVFGSSFQRVASCFVQGLADRMTLVQPLGSNNGLASSTMLSLMSGAGSDKKEEALTLVYELCPQIQFGHFVANSSILEAFEGESSVHVVDLGLTLGLPGGHQWRHLITSLANRSTGPPISRLKITAIGLLHASSKFQSIGNELEAYAKSLNVNMEFTIVQSSLENIKPNDFNIMENEVLVVNSMFQLHNVVKESRGALNSVLKIIHKLQPKTLVLVEQDSNHNGPFFLGRFMEALHYYSAIFDSLDAMLPKYDTRRAKIEQFYFAEEIKNIVSCEGGGRVERHERVDQWRRRMSRAGFQPVPIKMMSQAKQWMDKVKLCDDGHTIVEEKGCLVLGWKSKPIVAASCWKC